MSDKLWNEMSGGFEVSNHTFVKLLSEGLANKVKSINKDLGLKLIDKKVRNKNINGTLVSTLTIEGEDLEEVKKKMDALMNDLKIPSNLISLIGR